MEPHHPAELSMVLNATAEIETQTVRLRSASPPHLHAPTRLNLHDRRYRDGAILDLPTPPESLRSSPAFRPSFTTRERPTR